MSVTQNYMLAVTMSLVLGTWGCDGGDGGDEDTGTDTTVTDTVEDTSTDTAVEPGDCPGPSTGVDEGDIIQNHSFTTHDGGTVDLCGLRAIAGNRVLLIYGTAGWCTACTYESEALPGIYTDYHDDGLEILAVVFEDDSSAAADPDYASGYRDYYGFTFPTAIDPEPQIGDYFNTDSAPLNMFVDLETMEILQIDTGYATGGGPLRDDIETHLGL